MKKFSKLLEYLLGHLRYSTTTNGKYHQGNTLMKYFLDNKFHIYYFVKRSNINGN